jgi:hypothetical protein
MRPQANRAASARRITAGVLVARTSAKNTQRIDVPVLFGFALRCNIG